LYYNIALGIGLLFLISAMAYLIRTILVPAPSVSRADDLIINFLIYSPYPVAAFGLVVALFLLLVVIFRRVTLSLLQESNRARPTDTPPSPEEQNPSDI